MGACVVRTSSLNDKHSCQPFRMGIRDKTMPTSTTPLIRANITCAVATIFSSLAFLSSSVSMANLSRLVAASFSTSFSSPRFNILSMARRCFLWSSVSDDLFFPSSVFFGSPSCSIFFASYPQPIFPLFQSSRHHTGSRSALHKSYCYRIY